MTCKVDYSYLGIIQLKIILRYDITKQNNVCEKEKWFDIVQVLRVFRFSLQELTSPLDYVRKSFIYLKTL